MIKLGRLKLNNFKSFENGFFDFRNLDVVIFDGPNGYGKTSLFDAIEFCITGNISRIKEIDNKVKSTPLLRSNKNENGILNLEIIENDLTKVVIELVIPIRDIKNHKDNMEHQIFFYEKWEDIGGVGTSINIDSLQDFLNIENLNSLFKIFNYIQQEDSLHFLKMDEIQRHKQIDFLFGIDKQKNELIRIKKFEKYLNDNCSDVHSLLENLKSKNENFENEIKLLNNENYKSFFLKESHDYSKDFFVTYLSYFKKLSKSFLILNNYIDFKKNEFVVKVLNSVVYEKILTLKDFDNYIQLGRNIKRSKWLLSLEEKREVYNYLYSCLNGSLKSFLESILNCSEKRVSLIALKNIQIIEKYLFLLKNSNSLNSVLEEINFQRVKLISTCKDHVQDNTCPLCGSDFKDSDDLNASFQKMADNLKTISLHYTKDVEDLREEIYINVVEKIKTIIENYFKRFESLCVVLEDYKKFNISENEFYEIKHLTKKINDMNFYFNKDESLNHFLEKNGVNRNLSLNSDDVNNLDYVLRQLDLDVGENGVILKNGVQLSEKDIYNEISYLENKISQKNIIEISENNKKFNEQNLYFEELKAKKKVVTDLRIQYEKQIQLYESELVNNIQIPFYIYSSKILQTRGNESGIYLKVSKTRQHKNYIKFSSSKNDDNDAWNKMSSGQLAGLVISLMLTMNKVFPTNFKTLLIDDPVQTMDDINMASLVQLLSHEFNDYQLLLSTHESRITSFFKRKFSSFNNDVQSINLKNYRMNL